MRLGILTSSRADYGIYLPLLRKLSQNKIFDFKLIVFGTHLSKKHGYTFQQIRADNIPVAYKIYTCPTEDSPDAISQSIGETVIKFSNFWRKKKKEFDLIFCLGDRYEMYAAVLASVAFNIPIAHIHGGETTLGVIDNTFRHCLTLMSCYHFTSTAKSADRVKQIIGQNKNVFNVGALSLDNLKNLRLMSVQQFQKKYHIDLSIPTVLFTFHPETINPSKNIAHLKEIKSVLNNLDYQIIVTMPNADTKGNYVRNSLKKIISLQDNIIGVESLGTLGYFSCMKYCTFLLGNTSSGIIEAASFGKYVINLGNRQKGREKGENIIDCSIKKNLVINTVNSVQKLPKLSSFNIYGDGASSQKIINVLKKLV